MCHHLKYCYTVQNTHKVKKERKLPHENCICKEEKRKELLFTTMTATLRVESMMMMMMMIEKISQGTKRPLQ